jgi:hypothetical protein
MSAWSSPRSLAITALSSNDCSPNLHRDVAVECVDVVFDQLVDPDRDMEDAGADVLAQALAGGIQRRVARELAASIFRAMLDRARL